MKTEDLIAALVADGETPSPPLSRRLLAAAFAGAVLSAGLFALLVGPRPDVVAAAATPRFLLKFVECAGLATAATAATLQLTRPLGDRRAGHIGLALVAITVGLAVVVETTLVPSGEWGARLVGSNWFHCLTLVPLLALPPFVLMMAAARGGASTAPGRTGAVVGLAAGGIGAFFYAANCTDDSPLFVATWYTLAVASLALVGGLIGRRLLRW